MSEMLFVAVRAGAVRSSSVACRSHAPVSARPALKSWRGGRASLAFAHAGAPDQFDRSHLRLRWLPKTGSLERLKAFFEVFATSSSVVRAPVATLIDSPGSLRHVLSAALTKARVASST